MVINVEVQRTGSESNANLLRRFTKKVQSAGVLPRMRSIRYKSREQSSYNKKKRALRSIERKTEIEKMIKLGKMVERKKRR